MEKGKPVLINLLAIARYEHTPDYPVQMMTRGTLSVLEGNQAILEYTESQEDEETGEITDAPITLSIEKNRVTMTRGGDYPNTMVFSPDQRFEGLYRTPFGSLGMAVYSKGVQCDIGESRGSVHLKYQLDIQGAYTSTNELHLEYTENRSEHAQ